MTPPREYEWKVEPAENLLTGGQVARVRFRRKGWRLWRSFVVVLDDETTYATVQDNTAEIIARYEGQAWL